jgi:uncharacterized membrane protein YczE
MNWIKRIAIYVAGLFCVPFGIVFCKRCGIGISPISSIPYVLEIITGISFGTLTMLYLFANIIVQMILKKNFKDLAIWLEFVYAFAFGRVVDFAQICIPVVPQRFVVKIIFLILSIFLTAMGMHLMFQMNIVQNPPDGTVKLLSELLHIETGKMKIIFDCTMVAVAVVLGLIVLRGVYGLGIATVCSMIFVGYTLSWIRKIFPIRACENWI